MQNRRLLNFSRIRTTTRHNIRSNEHTSNSFMQMNNMQMNNTQMNNTQMNNNSQSSNTRTLRLGACRCCDMHSNNVTLEDTFKKDNLEDIYAPAPAPAPTAPPLESAPAHIHAPASTTPPLESAPAHIHAPAPTTPPLESAPAHIYAPAPAPTEVHEHLQPPPPGPIEPYSNPSNPTVENIRELCNKFYVQVTDVETNPHWTNPGTTKLGFVKNDDGMLTTIDGSGFAVGTNASNCSEVSGCYLESQDVAANPYWDLLNMTPGGGSVTVIAGYSSFAESLDPSVWEAGTWGEGAEDVTSSHAAAAAICSECSANYYPAAPVATVDSVNSLYNGTSSTFVLEVSYNNTYGCKSCDDLAGATCGQMQKRIGCGGTSHGTCSVVCPAGDGPILPDRNACETCPPGTWAWSGSLACTKCSPGSYAPTKGASSCLPCPAGSYQDQSGATSCILCPHNTYSGKLAAASQSTCKICLETAVDASGYLVSISGGAVACNNDKCYTKTKSFSSIGNEDQGSYCCGVITADGAGLPYNDGLGGATSSHPAAAAICSECRGLDMCKLHTPFPNPDNGCTKPFCNPIAATLIMNSVISEVLAEPCTDASLCGSSLKPLGGAAAAVDKLCRPLGYNRLCTSKEAADAAGLPHKKGPPPYPRCTAAWSQDGVGCIQEEDNSWKALPFLFGSASAFCCHYDPSMTKWVADPSVAYQSDASATLLCQTKGFGRVCTQDEVVQYQIPTDSNSCGDQGWISGGNGSGHVYLGVPQIASVGCGTKYEWSTTASTGGNKGVYCCGQKGK